MHVQRGEDRAGHRAVGHYAKTVRNAAAGDAKSAIDFILAVHAARVKIRRDALHAVGVGREAPYAVPIGGFAAHARTGAVRRQVLTVHAGHGPRVVAPDLPSDCILEGARAEYS